jgi:LysM repeat protein
VLKVPVGTAATIQKELVSAEPLYVRFDSHVVRRGDSLATISRKYRISMAELRQANDLSATARVKVGQTLMIPQHQAISLPAPTARTARAATAPAARQAAAVTYRVQAGDTLFSIAKRFDTTVDVIKQLNRLSTNTIGVGDRLTVRR